ncbi:hypothetical protein VTN96DRAFT_6805 [Rasamsonia emersonii]
MVGIAGRSRRCKTCRRRKVKCDEGRPVCDRCKKGLFQCEGYRAFPVFVNRTAQEPRSSAPDRQLSTPAFLLRNNLSQDEENLFTSHLLASLFTEAVDSHASQVSPWVVYAMQHSGPNCAALQALAAAYFGKVHHHQSALRKGALLYIDALRGLRRDLHALHTVDATTLTNALFLAIYESVTFNDPAGWVTHFIGIGRLIEARGPYCHQTGLEKEIFLVTRSIIAIGHVVERKRCFLEQDVWKTTPWALSPASKSVMDYLLDILCDIPGILEDADLLQQNFGSASELRGIVCQRLGSCVQDLYSWRWQWERQFSKSHFLVEMEQLQDIGLEQMQRCPFSTAIFFNE